MSLFDRLTHFAARRGDSLQLPEVETLLDHFPQSVLLVNLIEERILAGNAHALKLSGYTRAELAGLSIRHLLPDWAAESSLELTQGLTGSLRLSLQSRLGQASDVEITPINLDPEGSLAALAIEPLRARKKRQVEQDTQSRLLVSLGNLIQATQMENLPMAFQMALEASQALTGADSLAIYQLLPHTPELVRYAYLGDAEALPENIRKVDMTQLQRANLWTPGKLAISNIQRTAKSAGFKYVVTVPLGESSALLGLLVIGDHTGAPHDQLLPVSTLISHAITSLLQVNLLTTNLRDKLFLQQVDLAQAMALMDEIEDGVIVLNANLRILKLNSSAELILGYASQEIQGQPVQNILIGTDTLIPALRAAQEGVATHNIGDIRLHRRDGQTFRAHVSTRPVTNEGRLERILIAFRDLSEHEAYRLRTHQLEQQAFLGELTAIFAHEVRNPINNISTGLELMAMNLPEDDPNQKVIARLLEDCQRLEHQMKSVLDFSRTNEYNLEPINLEEVLDWLLERWRPRMARVKVAHHLQVEEATPAVLGDRRALEQVFTNLISNSTQAMTDSGGTLAIKAYRLPSSTDRHRVVISVSDTGPGIPEENLDHIFKPFYTTKPGGTGLGLAITKQIITAHKGTIQVSSFPGGTMFQIVLPAA